MHLLAYVYYFVGASIWHDIAVNPTNVQALVLYYVMIQVYGIYAYDTTIYIYMSAQRAEVTFNCNP